MYFKYKNKLFFKKAITTGAIQMKKKEDYV